MFGKKYFGLRGNALNWAVGMLAGLDFFLFGYDQGVYGGLLTLPAFVAQFPRIDTTSSAGKSGTSGEATLQGITIGSYNLGCVVGALLCIWVGDILGRRRVILTGSSIMVVGAAIQAGSVSLGMLIAGRVITGVGNGMNTSTVPMWQSETTKSHKRGKMVMIEGALITGGIATSYWVDFGLSFTQGSVSWRFPVALQILFALVIVALIMELPESPRWLMLKGREDEALDVIAALNDLPEDNEEVRAEFSEIKDSVAESAQVGFRDLLTMGKERNFHRAALGSVAQMLQQITGINLITYYAATIYENSIGLDGQLSRILAACNGTEYFAASWVAVFTIEKFGRRKLMIFGAVGMSLSMVALAASTSVGGSAPGIAAAVFLFVFNTFFAIGWLGMTWLYPAEIVPLQIRAQSNAVSTSVNFLFNFLIVIITPIAFATIEWRTYIIFAVINFCLVPVVYFFYPETAYRSLEEMDDIFARSKGAFDVVKIAMPKNTPFRFDKNGNQLTNYFETDVHRRRSSVRSLNAGAEKASVENRPRIEQDEAHKIEGGFAGDRSS